jgi:hypothetical protein
VQFSSEIENSTDFSVMPCEVRAEGDLFNTDLAETGISLFMTIFDVSIDISVVFTLYSTQSAGIAVLFVFFTAIYPQMNNMHCALYCIEIPYQKLGLYWYWLIFQISAIPIPNQYQEKN